MPLFHPQKIYAGYFRAPVREGQSALSAMEKVFWLPDHPVSRAFPSAFAEATAGQ